MMQILIYHGKYGDSYWLADTKEHLNAALKALFKMMDGMGYYIDEDSTHLEQARAGNLSAIKGILESRRSYEYEDWEIEYVTIAT